MASYIGRRKFLAALGGAGVAWPLAGRAQQPARIPRVGVIDFSPLWEPFKQGLRDLGYNEGQNIAIEYRTAEDRPDRLIAAATELARLPVDVIVTYGTPATLAAKKATPTIPIVMMGIGDPLTTGIVASLARPGGNVTGTTILGPDVVSKRLQLLKEAVPTVSKVAFLWNPSNASNVVNFAGARHAAPTLGMTMLSVEVRDSQDFNSAFTTMMGERPHAFLMTADPLHLRNIAWIIDNVGKHKLPAMYQVKDNVVAGGLMSYGASLPELLRRSAGIVQRILQGAKPMDLPVEQPTKFELVINLKTAKALDLEVPPGLLARADEVIE